LYRVNSKGLFNVPYNNSATAKTISEENLINIGRYLTENDVKIRLGDFEAACFDCSKNDFVYLDSPYIPVSKTAYFTDYTKDGFTYEDHKRLSELFRNLDKKGIKVMLSNNDVPLVYEL
jgi:DNA adenine methylase